MRLADRLKDVREKTGKSARAVSIAAGLSPNTVAEIEANPDRSPRLEHVQKIARVLGVSLAYLAEGQHQNTPSHGMSESEAEPWRPRTVTGERPDLADFLRRIAQVLAPDARSPTTFALRQAMPGFALMKGDVLVVDLKAPAQSGDLVLANVADLATGTGTTVVRRLMPPYLIANDPETDQGTLVVDNARTTIMGKIVAALRAPQLAA